MRFVLPMFVENVGTNKFLQNSVKVHHIRSLSNLFDVLRPTSRASKGLSGLARYVYKFYQP
jgi:hypothetical protein